MNTYHFSVIIEKDEDGYFAYCPELEGCHTEGDTYDEALENIKDAINLYVADLVDSGEVIPSSKFVSLTSLDVQI